MSSRMKGAGGVGGEDDDEEKALPYRTYPPGLQPGGELHFCFLPCSLFTPHELCMEAPVSIGS